MRRCRYGAGGGRRACGAPAVAALRRSNGEWNYCADHLYGRIVEHGRILGLYAREVTW